MGFLLWDPTNPRVIFGSFFETGGFVLVVTLLELGAAIHLFENCQRLERVGWVVQHLQVGDIPPVQEGVVVQSVPPSIGEWMDTFVQASGCERGLDS